MTARGRPTVHTPELAKTICDAVASGEGLRAICRDLNIAESTVREWVVDDREGFAAQYARSRDIGLDVRAERIEEKFQAEEDTARARLVFDHERWYLSKLAPKRYGDKLDLNHSGSIAISHEAALADLEG